MAGEDRIKACILVKRHLEILDDVRQVWGICGEE